jgi:hypothetical protein
LVAVERFIDAPTPPLSEATALEMQLVPQFVPQLHREWSQFRLFWKIVPFAPLTALSA